MSHSSYSKLDEHGRPVRAVPVSREEQKTKRISAKIDGVKGVMHNNIAKATARGAQLRDLEDQTEQLEASGNAFLKSSGDVKNVYRWKAFVWQLAFAAVVLLILSALTLYILSATGVLNNQGRGSSTPNTVVSYVPPSDESSSSSSSLKEKESSTDISNNALFSVKSHLNAFQQPKDLPKSLFAVGEKCSLSESTSNCKYGLVCVATSDSTEGVCRPKETLGDSQSTKESAVSETKPEKKESESACPKGEVACTQELNEEGVQCIIGRCIIQAVPNSEKSDNTPSTLKKSDDSANNEPKPSSPLLGGSRVFQPKGENPSQTEKEIVDALVTLHRHGADCSVGILHKDCTLDLMMKSWG